VAESWPRRRPVFEEVLGHFDHHRTHTLNLAR
jgi:hypothetical protein